MKIKVDIKPKEWFALLIHQIKLFAYHINWMSDGDALAAALLIFAYLTLIVVISFIAFALIFAMPAIGFALACVAGLCYLAGKVITSLD